MRRAVVKPRRAVQHVNWGQLAFRANGHKLVDVNGHSLAPIFGSSAQDAGYRTAGTAAARSTATWRTRLRLVVDASDMLTKTRSALSHMVTERAFISLWPRMFVCDVAVQRVEVFEYFAALRTSNPILCLAVKLPFREPSIGTRV